MLAAIDFESFIGNESVKQQIKIALGAARLHNRPLPHTLLLGPPGMGKTSLSRAIANYGQMPFIELSPEAIGSPEDLAEVFNKLPADGYDRLTGEVIGTINPPVIFIDEAHRLSLKAEESLGIAMENWRHSFIEGRGRRKRNVTCWVPRFTLVCATTIEGGLSKPFRERFKLTYSFKEYSLSEALQVLLLHAKLLGITIDGQCAMRIAQRARGTPRLLVRYLESVRDAMVFLGRENLTGLDGIGLVEAQFELMKIDPEGLTEGDIAILKALYESDYELGWETLALQTNQDKKTVSEVIEPFLLRLGLITRSKQGRVITDRGVEHLVKYNHIETSAVSMSRDISRSEPH